MKEQLSALLPRAEVLSAIADLVGSITSVLNAISGNPRVAGSAAHKLDPAALDWLFVVQKRVDLDDSLGGHLIIVAK